MTERALCVRAWWGTHRLATHVLNAGLAEAALRVGPGAGADLFFPSAVDARFRCVGEGFELVVPAGVKGRLVRGVEAVAFTGCLARGWARASGDLVVLPLAEGDVVHLEAGAVRVEAFGIPRASGVAAAPDESLDARWFASLGVVGSLAMLWLAFASVTPTRPGGDGAGQVPLQLVHLVVKAPRASPPPSPPARLSRAAPARRRSTAELANILLAGHNYTCLCKPCWVQCGRPVVTVPKTVRCERGACADTEPVRELLRAHLGQARYCLQTYGQWTREKEALRFSVDVAATGEVEAVRVAPSETQSTDALDCVRARVRRWRFPAQPNGDYRVSFQFGFRWDFS